MAVTYVPDAGRLVKLAVAAETTFGTYVTPSTQLALVAPPSFGLGHQVIEGAAMTGTVQQVITHRAVRGLDIPFVSVEIPFSANSMSVVWQMITGSALAANAWLISTNPTSFSIGILMQRSAGGGDYFKFAGCHLAAAAVEMPLGGMSTVRLDFLARTLTFPDTAPATFPTLTPTVSSRPYVLKDCAFKHNTTDSFGGQTAVPFKGFSMGINCGLLVEHNSTATTPDSLVRTAFDVTGEIRGRFSAEWWDEWKAIIAGESSGGFTRQYLEMLVTDGSSPLRFTLPATVDMPAVAPDDLGMAAPLRFMAAGDDATPTVAVLRGKNV